MPKRIGLSKTQSTCRVAGIDGRLAEFNKLSNQDEKTQKQLNRLECN